MLFSKANLAVTKVASDDPKDASLNCVHFTVDGATVASNGKCIMAVSPVNEDNVHFPFDGAQAEPFAEGVSVELDIVDQAVRNLPRDKRMSLQHVAMTRCDNLKVEFTTVDMRKEQRVAGAPVREEFPQWKTIMREARARAVHGRLCINRRDLMQLLDAMDQACPDPGEAPLFIELGGELDGIILRSQNYETAQQAIGFIMPLNTNGKWLGENAWVDATLGIVRSAITAMTKVVRRVVKGDRA